MIGTLAVCVAIFGAAVGFRLYLAHKHPPEKVTEVVFLPLDEVRAVAAVDAVRAVAPNELSTTLPISASSQDIPMETSVDEGALDVSVKKSMENGGDMHGMTPLAKARGGYVVKYANGQLCNAQGACPMAVFARSASSDKPDTLLFTTHAKSIKISNQTFGGNPDIIVDYGFPDMPPVRMYWDEESDTPTYMAYPLSATKPLH